MTLGTLGGQAELRLVPLPRPWAATALPGLPRWLVSLRSVKLSHPTATTGGRCQR
jgi:hypothetical protein